MKNESTSFLNIYLILHTPFLLLSSLRLGESKNFSGEFPDSSVAKSPLSQCSGSWSGN